MERRWRESLRRHAKRNGVYLRTHLALTEESLARRLIHNSVSGQGKIRYGIECAIFVLSFQKARVTSGGDHRGVVGGKRAAREKDFQAIALCLGFENGAQLAIRGDAAGNANRAHALICGGSKRTGYQVVHHSVLETRH